MLAQAAKLAPSGTKVVPVVRSVLPCTPVLMAFDGQTLFRSLRSFCVHFAASAVAAFARLAIESTALALRWLFNSVFIATIATLEGPNAHAGSRLGHGGALGRRCRPGHGGAVLGFLPTFFIFILMQRFIIQGISLSGVKG